MNIRILSFFILGITIFSVGCTVLNSSSAAKDQDAVLAARQLIVQNKAGCVIIKNGKIIHDGSGRGISPILTIYRQHPEKMKNSIVVDKVIGKAAAMVAICGGVSRVHAELICDSAVDVLEKHNIPVTYTLRVKNILNRRRNGLCPMEQVVLNIDDPQTAVTALEEAVRKMNAKSE